MFERDRCGTRLLDIASDLRVDRLRFPRQDYEKKRQKQGAKRQAQKRQTMITLVNVSASQAIFIAANSSDRVRLLCSGKWEDHAGSFRCLFSDLQIKADKQVHLPRAGIVEFYGTLDDDDRAPWAVDLTLNVETLVYDFITDNESQTLAQGLVGYAAAFDRYNVDLLQEAASEPLTACRGPLGFELIKSIRAHYYETTIGLMELENCISQLFKDQGARAIDLRTKQEG
jgi:hypothetical protein